MPDEILTKETFTAEKAKVEQALGYHDKRLTQVETELRDLRGLTSAVERLADRMARFSDDQQTMLARINSIEAEPAEKWKKATWLVVTAVIAAVAGYLIKSWGL